MTKPRVKVTTDGRVRVNDGFVNMAAGLGGSRDKAASNTYHYVPVSHYAATVAYRQSPLAKKIINIIPEDATRKWRKWNAEADVISEIEKIEKIHRLQEKAMLAMRMERLSGGAALYISIEGQESSEPLDPTTVTKDSLRTIAVLSRYSLTCTKINADINDPDFGQPAMFHFSGTGNGSTSGGADIHPSRLVVLPGDQLPTSTGISWSWGDGVLQAMLETIKQTDSFPATVSSLLLEASVDILTIPRLMEMMREVGGEEKVATYLRSVASIKSINGMLILDGGDDSVEGAPVKGVTYDRKAIAFGGIADLWDRMMLMPSGGSDIPATRLWGRSPAGMNSTGESDEANYRQVVSNLQSNRLTPAMSVLDEVLQRSATGDYDDAIYYDWIPLEEESEAEKSARGKTTAEILTSLKNMGVFSEETMQAITVAAMVETGSLPGLESAIEENGLDFPDEDEDEAVAALAALQQGGGKPVKPPPAPPAPPRQGVTP